MSNNKPHALIVGGSSGLGFELALALSSTHDITVTGRQDPKSPWLTFRELELSPREDNLSNTDPFDLRSPVKEFLRNMSRLVAGLPHVDLFVYAAGFYQEGLISDLSDTDIINMNYVGLIAPQLLLQRLMKKQNELSGFIAVTSTSQWTPRLKESPYTGTKGGLKMFADSASLDDRIGKVLVAAPAGMDTPFWKKTKRDDLHTMLDPEWVAEQILLRYSDNFKFRFDRILRGPARVEPVETR